MKATFYVTAEVEVEMDESKFTEEFMQEFRESFYDFDNVRQHAAHIAQMTARGVVESTAFNPDEFIEGYGPASDMGIKTRIKGWETDD